MYKNVLIKIYDVTAWETNNFNARIANISRIKDNLIMKFGQFIEYNMRKMFLQKSYTKCGGKTILRPFSEKSKLSISLD